MKRNDSLPEGITQSDTRLVEFLGKSSLWISAVCGIGLTSGLFLLAAAISYLFESQMTFEFAIQMASLGSLLVSLQFTRYATAGAISAALLGFLVFICGAILTLAILYASVPARIAYRGEAILAILTTAFSSF